MVQINNSDQHPPVWLLESGTKLKPAHCGLLQHAVCAWSRVRLPKVPTSPALPPHAS